MNLPQEKLSSSITLRGGKERIFDDMNNGFVGQIAQILHGRENTVFLLLRALIRNFYKAIMSRLDTKAFGLKKTSHKGFCLQIHLRTCQVDHDCKAIRAEYLHREPRLCKTLQNRIRIRILSFRLESAYYLKSHRGVRGCWLHIDVVLLLFTESCY